MPIIDSPYWNERLGVCEKHYLPQIPCPQCLAEKDPDVEVRLNEMDRAVLDFEPELSVKDLLPAKNADWLKARLVP